MIGVIAVVAGLTIGHLTSNEEAREKPWPFVVIIGMCLAAGVALAVTGHLLT